MVAIVFNKQGEQYYSDPVQATGSNIVFRVEFSTPGKIMLERSITGDNFIPECLLNPNTDGLIVEKGITGVVPGQYLRLCIIGSEPTNIYVLQDGSTAE